MGHGGRSCIRRGDVMKRMRPATPGGGHHCAKSGLPPPALAIGPLCGARSPQGSGRCCRSWEAQSRRALEMAWGPSVRTRSHCPHHAPLPRATKGADRLAIHVSALGTEAHAASRTARHLSEPPQRRRVGQRHRALVAQARRGTPLDAWRALRVPPPTAQSEVEESAARAGRRQPGQTPRCDLAAGPPR